MLRSADSNCVMQYMTVTRNNSYSTVTPLHLCTLNKNYIQNLGGKGKQLISSLKIYIDCLNTELSKLVYQALMNLSLSIRRAYWEMPKYEKLNINKDNEDPICSLSD